MDQRADLAAETARVRGLYDRMAERYDGLIAGAERMLFADGRSWVCAGLGGRVLEVAVGTGRNLPHHAPGTDLVGLDVSPGMLDLARRRSRELARPVALVEGDAHRLPFPDRAFDAVVATLTLCSIPDERAAVAEMARVLRPGGQLVLLDHVASPRRTVRAVQRVLDPLLVRCQGDHLLREPDRAVREAGLVVDELARSKAGIVLRLRAHRRG